MRFEKVVLMLVVVMAVSSAAAYAGKGGSNVSLDRGKALFGDPKLGTNGRSCSECHPNGKGMDRAATRPDLPAMVNGCIARALKGTALDENSAEMGSLLLYIRSFGKQGGR